MIIQVGYDTMRYYDVVGYSSSDVTSGAVKFKGQRLFSLLVFIGCSSGSNNGLGWIFSLL